MLRSQFESPALSDASADYDFYVNPTAWRSPEGLLKLLMSSIDFYNFYTISDDEFDVANAAYDRFIMLVSGALPSEI